MKADQHNGQSLELKIGLRSLGFAAGILLLLMILTGTLTRVIPSGAYETRTVEGLEQVIPGSFSYLEKTDIPFWRWFTAPVEVLWGPDSTTVISIILFMCLISGAIQVMNRAQILNYSIAAVTRRFAGRRFMMEAMIILMFMLFGSVLGSMEEVVVLVPLAAALARSMGWDTITGLGMSLGAIAFGFASAISNPFTIGVAQNLAGVPIFSGVLYRILIFIIIYLLYTAYVIRYSSRSQQEVSHEELSGPLFSSSEVHMQQAVSWFAGMIVLMIIMIITASMISSLSSFVLPIVLLFFLLGGIGSGFLARLTVREVLGSFTQGIGNVAAGAILVLMAASIKHIMYTAGIMDTILHAASLKIASASPGAAALMIYMLVLILNFFISSGSAKAFLIIPIAAPLADMVGLSRQTAILAYIFGDGFSNILYPTNALLLICLSITGVSYRAWFKWIWKIELLIFTVTIALLLAAVAIGY